MNMRIWQAFADLDCAAGTHYSVGLHRDYETAYRWRLLPQARAEFKIQRRSRLRRVTWVMPLGMEAGARLKAGPDIVCDVALIGSGSVAWSDLDWIDAGWHLWWDVACFGIAGRVTATFDFEAEVLPPSISLDFMKSLRKE